MNVEEIDHLSPHLVKVKSLGKANAGTLGFLPEGAFDDHASRRQILVALDEDGSCIGYLLYRISRQRVSIAHLCVENHLRQQGISRLLVNKLKEITKDLHGIGLWCRRDYAASNVWPRLNFVARRERQGRGKAQKLLTYWWFDQGHPTLFTNENPDSKICVVVDANVFFDLADSSRPGYEESGSLAADWLLDTLDICVTDEIYNEINKSEKGLNERTQEREFADTFKHLPIQSERLDQTLETLNIVFQAIFSKPLTSRDEADLRQLARTIVSSAKIFVTRDGGLLAEAFAEKVYETFGVRIIRPSDLVIKHDELRREDEYQPVRLAGTLSKIQLVQSGQEDWLTASFQCSGLGESQNVFKRTIRPLIGNPENYNSYIVLDTEDQPLALFIYDNRDSQELRIPVLRLRRCPTATTLARHLLLHAIKHTANTNRVVVRVTDLFIDDILSSALTEDSFQQTGNNWLKLTFQFALEANKMANALKEIQVGETKATEIIEESANLLAEHNIVYNRHTVFAIERLLWPAKIIDSAIPTFVIPIQPEWAKELFDENLANQTLFGAKLDLALRRESVYYRRIKNHRGLCSPGRILWYVSQGSRYTETGSLRACSRIDEIITDKPKVLFQRFRRLGTFEWAQVFKLANHSLDEDIMAIRFSDTELFPTPISLSEIKRIATKENTNLGTIPSPCKIPNSLFAKLYVLGKSTNSGVKTNVS